MASGTGFDTIAQEQSKKASLNKFVDNIYTINTSDGKEHINSFDTTGKRIYI